MASNNERGALNCLHGSTIIYSYRQLWLHTWRFQVPSSKKRGFVNWLPYFSLRSYSGLTIEYFASELTAEWSPGEGVGGSERVLFTGSDRVGGVRWRRGLPGQINTNNLQII